MEAAQGCCSSACHLPMCLLGYDGSGTKGGEYCQPAVLAPTGEEFWIAMLHLQDLLLKVDSDA